MIHLKSVNKDDLGLSFQTNPFYNKIWSAKIKSFMGPSFLKLFVIKPIEYFLTAVIFWDLSHLRLSQNEITDIIFARFLCPRRKLSEPDCASNLTSLMLSSLAKPSNQTTLKLIRKWRSFLGSIFGPFLYKVKKTRTSRKVHHLCTFIVRHLYLTYSCGKTFQNLQMVRRGFG